MAEQGTMITIDKFTAALEERKEAIGPLLQKNGLDILSFSAHLHAAMTKIPKLLECTKESLFLSIVVAAELGLMPNTHEGYCYFLPYGKTCQFQLGYQGVLELMYRSGNVADVTAEVVYANDKFKEIKGSNPDLIHETAEGEPGDAIGAYALVWLNNGMKKWQYLNKAKLEEFQQISKTKWKGMDDPQGWFWKKTCIKQVAKLLPKTNNDLNRAINIDNIVEKGGTLQKNKEGIIEPMEDPETKKQREAQQAFEKKQESSDEAMANAKKQMGLELE